VASNFYDNAHKIEMMEMAQKGAVSPDKLPDDILRCVGRSVWSDIGGLALGVRAGTHNISYDALSMLFAKVAPLLPDYKKYNQQRM
jgi:hypothetical protein